MTTLSEIEWLRLVVKAAKAMRSAQNESDVAFDRGDMGAAGAADRRLYQATEWLYELLDQEGAFEKP